MNTFICGYPNCGTSFPCRRGLNLHEDSDARHSNPDKKFHRFSGSGNLRHKISYERSVDSENNAHKKKISGPQKADINILRSMINPNISTGSEFDDYYSFANDDGDEDDEADEPQIGISDIIYNIYLQENLDFEDIQHPCHPDVIQKHIFAYRHYQSILYNQSYGINALESNDMQPFKFFLNRFRSNE